MKNKVKSVSMTEVRVLLPRLRKRVQLGGLVVLPTYYTDVVGVIINMPLSKTLNIGSSEEVAITKFREKATEYWEKLQSEIDCVYLTSHSRKVMAFVSPKFISELNINLPSISVLDCEA
jgi:hypothetical protein